MNPKHICPHCGSLLADNLAEGLCPKCIAKVSLTKTEIAEPGKNPEAVEKAAESPAQATLSGGAIAPGQQGGERIGRYRLLEELGKGGMGVVWLAEQKEPVQRKVALKVIKAGMDSEEILARFEAERQALALMAHPNIARVLDAGATPEGRPYFVMELVTGVPINQYCDEKRLTVKERLELFITVCHAVQHAHQKGIIHRDLKPSNVLVMEVDGQAIPKVIDFGIAKAMGMRLTERTLHTLQGILLGSPAYMAPEQAKLDSLDLDTRSDIYSLGVLLYELLTGSTPILKETLHSAAVEEMLRMIREEEVPTPSQRITSRGEKLRALADLRKLEPKAWVREIEGELDWIAMKALEKDRSRRYDSASGFARDVQRHLNNEPIEARAVSRWSKTKKWIQRHPVHAAWLALWASACFFTLIAAGVVVNTNMASKHRAMFDFNKMAESRAMKIQQDIERSIEAAAAVAAFYAATEEVTRVEFAVFTGHLLRRNDTISYIEWVPRVHHGQRKQFEQKVRITRMGSNRELIEDDTRTEYYPTLFTEPRWDSQQAVGFNHDSENKRMVAMDLARDSGLPAASNWLVPYQTGTMENTQHVILVYHPVYTNGLSQSKKSDRRQNLAGYIAVTIHIDRLFGHTASEESLKTMELVVTEQLPANDYEPGIQLAYGKQGRVMLNQSKNQLLQSTKAKLCWEGAIDACGTPMGIFIFPTPEYMARWRTIDTILLVTPLGMFGLFMAQIIATIRKGAAASKTRKRR